VTKTTFPLSQQPIEIMNIEGFLPVIINIAPVNVQLLLGLADQAPPFKTATHEEPEKLSYFEPVQRFDLPPSKQVIQ
jgi:hypothetical protein